MLFFLDIRVIDYGLALLEVSDNGNGIREKDFDALGKSSNFFLRRFFYLKFDFFVFSSGSLDVEVSEFRRIGAPENVRISRRSVERFGGVVVSFLN